MIHSHSIPLESLLSLSLFILSYFTQSLHSTRVPPFTLSYFTQSLHSTRVPPFTFSCHCKLMHTVATTRSSRYLSSSQSPWSDVSLSRAAVTLTQVPRHVTSRHATPLPPPRCVTFCFLFRSGAAIGVAWRGPRYCSLRHLTSRHVTTR